MSRADRRAATRSRILTAAARLVARSGPEQLSLREVARSAGYSPAGLYAYFDGREGILAALAERDAAALIAALEAAGADAPAHSHPLTDLALAYLDFATRHPGRLQLALQHPGEEVAAVFVARVEACVAAGEFLPGPGFDVEEIAATLRAAAHGFATLKLSPELLREGMRCMLEGLRG